MRPRVFNVLAGDALEVRQTPYGAVGEVYRDDDVVAEWVSKAAEQVDPGWFSQPMVDLLLVVQGQLRIEFESAEHPARTLQSGELLVLPAGVRCRAYRWPRDAVAAAVFIAFYPAGSSTKR
jgi:uncharacterized protein YjlB